VDTPPSRSALDFLDAPARLSRFLDGRMLRVLLAPARAGGRSVFNLVTASFGVFSRAVAKVLGGQLLSDLSGFISALDSTFGGFRERAEATYQILQAPETAFLVVTTPEPDAVREAGFFAGRLARDNMPLHGLVLNRTHTISAPDVSAEDALAAAAELDRAGIHASTADALRIHAALSAQVTRETEVTRTFTRNYPSVPMIAIAAQPADVHDIDGLREIGATFGAMITPQ